MSGFRVVIGGGGIAAVEGCCVCGASSGTTSRSQSSRPEPELRYRPLASRSRSPARGASLPARADRHRDGAQLVRDALEWVDADAQVVHTAAGAVVRYDALLLAVGARSVAPFEHVTTFDDANADDTYRGIVRDIEGGYAKAVALIVPDGPPGRCRSTSSRSRPPTAPTAPVSTT